MSISRRDPVNDPPLKTQERPRKRGKERRKQKTQKREMEKNQVKRVFRG